ncbi:MAG: hypothetical protein Q9218_001978 [Villophora microphyllina]
MAPASPPPKRQLPQPIENTERVHRRFAPEPVETSARSNRPVHGNNQPAPEAGTVRSRVLPQPVESSARSSKKQDKPNDTLSAAASDIIPSARRNLPQPIESTKSSSRSRKFAPDLVETTSRQRKRGDTLPTVLDTDKTEHDPKDPIHHRLRQLRLSRPGAQPIPPVNSPIASTEQVPQLHESKFSYANIIRRASLEKPDRRHSFRRPELPSIPSQTEESEESDGSTCTSLSSTPSAGPNDAELHRNVGKSKGGKASGHLLSLAAQAAEKQLREQAMAAYPNERFYEPVDHFAVDREDADSDGEGVGLLSRSATYPPPGGGSDSTAPSSRHESHAGWDATKTRIHKDGPERQRRERKEKDQAAGIGRKHSVREPTKEHHHGHQHDHGHHHHHQHGEHHHKQQSTPPKNQGTIPNMTEGQHKDDQMKSMHKAASPPMAGQNLKFPKCQSPRNTRLDVHQYPGAPSYLGVPKSRDHSGLWTPEGSASRQNSKSGLWMGVCAQSAQKPPGPAFVQTGLLTPASERGDPFSSTTEEAASTQQLPPSLPTSFGSSKPSCLDTVLSREKAIEDEFHDGFVTQVYNYLSLGYPALARKYDYELSKITRVPVGSLRQDDARADAKGYVGAPEGTGEDLQGVQEGRCERWTALRLYIREWARQQPMFGAGDGAAQGGVRKGSWAA